MNKEYQGPAWFKALLDETGTEAADWEPLDGVPTGVGLEFWMRHRDGREAYVVVDQDEVTISLDGEERLARGVEGKEEA